MKSLVCTSRFLPAVPICSVVTSVSGIRRAEFPTRRGWTETDERNREGDGGRIPHHAAGQPGRLAGVGIRPTAGAPGAARPRLLETGLRFHPPDLVLRPREGPGPHPGLLRLGARERFLPQVRSRLRELPDIPQVGLEELR